MNWKNLPYWVKGGITGLFIEVLYFFIGLLIPSFGEILTDTLAVIFKPALYLLNIFGFQQKLALGSLISYITFSFILYGIIVGYLYGKIKNRSQKIIDHENSG